MGISIARARQIITVFPYNILSPNKILGVPGPKNFRMPWIMTQEQIYQKNFLAKCDFRRRVSMGPQPPCPLLLWGTWKYFSNMSFFGRDYSLSLFYSPSFLLSLFLFIFPALQWAIPRKKKKLRTCFFFKKPPEISSYITYL